MLAPKKKDAEKSQNEDAMTRQECEECCLRFQMNLFLANSVITGQLRGHNDTPFGRPTLNRPIGRPKGVFGGLNYYQLVISFLTFSP
jgi:hypothetical protein